MLHVNWTTFVLDYKHVRHNQPSSLAIGNRRLELTSDWTRLHPLQWCQRLSFWFERVVDVLHASKPYAYLLKRVYVPNASDHVMVQAPTQARLPFLFFNKIMPRRVITMFDTYSWLPEHIQFIERYESFHLLTNCIPCFFTIHFFSKWTYFLVLKRNHHTIVDVFIFAILLRVKWAIIRVIWIIISHPSIAPPIQRQNTLVEPPTGHRAFGRNSKNNSIVLYFIPLNSP